jgi:hypothetical protein
MEKYHIQGNNIPTDLNNNIGNKHQRDDSVTDRINKYFIDVRTGCVTTFNPKVKGDGDIARTK